MIFLSFLLVLNPVWGWNSAASTLKPPLEIIATLSDPQASLFEKEPPLSGEFPVIGKVRNSTETDLILSEMTCSFLDSWITNNENLKIVSQSCLSNFPHSLKLKPGEVHEVTVPLMITTSIADGPLRFRIGYKASQAVIEPKVLPHDLGRSEMSGSPFWSNELTIQLRSSPEKRQLWLKKKKWFDDTHAQDRISPPKDGVLKRSYFNGKIMDERSFKGGDLDGPLKEYYENGRLKTDANYRGGKPDGTFKSFRDDGKISTKDIYYQGELLESVTYNLNGSIHGHMVFAKVVEGQAVRVRRTCVLPDSDSDARKVLPLCGQ